MTPQDIQSALLTVLKEVQTLSGRAWNDIKSGDKPIGTLAGFDSLCSIEATVLLEQSLGGVALGKNSLFVSESGDRALTVEEISQRAHNLMNSIKGKP